MNAVPVYVGVDVSKGHLSLALCPTVETFDVPNDDAGIDALVARLEEVRPCW